MNLFKPCVWFINILCLLIMCLWLSWHLWAKQDFAYEFLYDHINIDQHIATYAPQNAIKQGFELTTREERLSLFSTIVDGIHDKSIDLGVLVYHNKSGQPLAVLLTEEEVVHLEDVANLVSVMNKTGMAATLLFIILSFIIFLKRWPRPRWRVLAAIASFPIALLIFALVKQGLTDFFYWLHTLVFPPDHQWFFFYQESLMTTLMKAPDLFGYIVSFWLSTTALVWMICLIIIHVLTVRRVD